MTELDRAGLDRILPATSGSADWDDVLRRFGAHRSRRRRRAIVAAVLAGFLVLPAYGLGGRLLQLISPPGTGPEVWGISWSPDGERLAFGSGWVEHGDTDVYVLTADGGSWRLTHVGERVQMWPHPAWSPDGEWLAFVTTRTGNSGIHVVNRDGGVRTVARAQAEVAGLGWSPDGRKLVFLTRRDIRDRNPHVSMVNLDGTGRRDLTREWGLDELPVWSPDGRMIAFSTPSDGKQAIGREIHVVNADGSGRRRLTRSMPGAGDPRWSPDGRRIAFQIFPSPSGRRAGIHIANVDGSGQRRVAQDASAANWSPDGRRIAFRSQGCIRPFDVCLARRAPGIYVMNADRSGQWRLTREDGFGAWSPDGRKIAYVSSRGNYEIYLVNPNGSGRRNLTRNPTFDSQPTWSPEGRRIAFSSKRDGVWGIYLMNADGSGQERLGP